MTKSILSSIVLVFAVAVSNAQTPMQFSGVDCDGAAVDLFADLDSGKAVVLHFYMPSCGSCPPPAQKIQTMAMNVNDLYPGMVKGYAFPYQNSTTCTYSASWVSSNNLGSLFQAMDSGATQVAHYGGFGMPTVVLLGGSDSNRRVLFSTLSFSNSDTTIMRDSILALLDTSGTDTSTFIESLPGVVSVFRLYPNPSDDHVFISLNMQESAPLLIEVTDLMGNVVAIISDEPVSGTYDRQFSTAELPSGNYLVRMQVNGETITRKLTVDH